MSSVVAVTSASRRVALVTGAATRIGAATAAQLHKDGYNVAIHYKTSRGKAEALCETLNKDREGSAAVFGADLGVWREGGAGASSATPKTLQGICNELIAAVVERFGDMHVLVNNASSFTKTPLLLSDDALAGGDDDDCDDEAAAMAEEALVVSNALAPFYLSRSFARHVQRAEAAMKKKKEEGDEKEKDEGTTAASSLAPAEGERHASPHDSTTTTTTTLPADRSIILFGDALVSRSPHRTYGLYSIAKIGAENFTQTASTELACVGIRVNCIRPGFNVFPEAMPKEECDRLRALIPVGGGKEGTPQDIAKAISFLVDPTKASYISGAMLDIDGGLRHIAKS